MARRLRVQGGVELLCAVLLPVVFLRVTGVTAGFVAAWVAVDAMLVVGACYWFARAVKASRGLPRTPNLGAFAVARIGLVVVLIVTLGVVVVDIAAGGDAVRWVAVVVWLFAVAEYVNYFHLQLSYQNAAELRRLLRRGRLVPAHLGRELARSVR
ncbi:hypothetical protein GCM10009609_10150 [Pseudonocardia aurantiaca]